MAVVFGIIMRWDGREPAMSDAIMTLGIINHDVRCHLDSGNNKAASLLLLRFTKVSNTKD